MRYLIPSRNTIRLIVLVLECGRYFCRWIVAMPVSLLERTPRANIIMRFVNLWYISIPGFNLETNEVCSQERGCEDDWLEAIASMERALANVLTYGVSWFLLFILISLNEILIMINNTNASYTSSFMVTPRWGMVWPWKGPWDQW